MKRDESVYPRYILDVITKVEEYLWSPNRFVGPEGLSMRE